MERAAWFLLFFFPFFRRVPFRMYRFCFDAPPTLLVHTIELPFNFFGSEKATTKITMCFVVGASRHPNDNTTANNNNASIVWDVLLFLFAFCWFQWCFVICLLFSCNESNLIKSKIVNSSNFFWGTQVLTEREGKKCARLWTKIRIFVQRKREEKCRKWVFLRSSFFSAMFWCRVAYDFAMKRNVHNSPNNSNTINLDNERVNIWLWLTLSATQTAFDNGGARCAMWV